jgi:hypothetical protein
MRARLASAGVLALAGTLLVGAGCYSPPTEPLNPGWSDVAPMFRGACNNCHGLSAKVTGNGYRFDFFDLDQIQTNCGAAADVFTSPNSPDATPPPIFAGATGVAKKIGQDIIKAPGAEWPRMPPQPSPALPDWELSTLTRWTEQPSPGLKPQNNHKPTLALSGLPATAQTEVDFTVVADDPDGDPVIGVIQVNGVEGFINRSGSFDFSFDSSSWPAGSQMLTATLCDGWDIYTTSFKVQISH